jgi:hypothetical protein
MKKIRVKEEEQVAKKMQIEEFKRKKAEERQRLMQDVSKERENEKKVNKISL